MAVVLNFHTKIALRALALSHVIIALPLYNTHKTNVHCACAYA